MVRPLAPCTDSGRIRFDDDLDAFGVQPQTYSSLISRPLPSPPPRKDQSPAAFHVDSLEALPPEVLEVIFSKLDGFSLNHVSRTCKFFRDVCFGLLEEKGLVLPVWKRISKGRLNWLF